MNLFSIRNECPGPFTSTFDHCVRTPDSILIILCVPLGICTYLLFKPVSILYLRATNHILTTKISNLPISYSFRCRFILWCVVNTNHDKIHFYRTLFDSALHSHIFYRLLLSDGTVFFSSIVNIALLWIECEMAASIQTVRSQ